MAPLRCFEDLEVGKRVELGAHTMTEEAIVAFGREFDPQPFHVDAEAAAASTFGGLVASGWHTVSVWMRLMVDGFLADTASLGSPGIDSLRWLAPVRPGDELHAAVTVLDATASRSKPDLGIVRFKGEVRNQRDETVLEMESVGFFARRPPAAPAPGG